LFYFFVHARKVFAFSPRLPLEPQKEQAPVLAATAGVMS
jgi:hypothetical protein